MYGIIKTGGLTYLYNRFHANYCIIGIIYIYISLYYKKISPPPPPPSRGRGGEGGRGVPQVLIILSSPKARNFLVCSEFSSARSSDLFELWVCSKFGFVRLHRPGVLAGRGARSAPICIYIYINIFEEIYKYIHTYTSKHI